jgi:hypothetical protein
MTIDRWLSPAVRVTAAAVLIAGMAAGQAAAATARARPRATAGGWVVTGRAVARSLAPLQPRSIPAATSGNGVEEPTLPFYTSSFSYAGKTYSYTSLGTDPRTSSAATHIPVIFIPIRVYVPGASNWPVGAIKQTTGSALFHNAAFSNNTQYGDATLRSGYWSYVKANGGKWHVLFDPPVTRPLLKVHVPAGKGTSGLDPDGYQVLLVDTTWLTNELFTIAKTVPANTLAVLLTYNVVGCADVSKQSTCGLGSLHGWSSDKAGTHVFAWASWDDSSVFVDHMASTSWMSSALAATLNNPFTDDTVPDWSLPSQPQVGCSDEFAVGDPLVGTFLTTGGLEYQDVADLSWFARQKPSIGFDGRYSFFGTLTKLPVSC